MRHRAKFHQNRSNGCRHMAISRFLKWRPSAILDFVNSNFSMVWTIKRPILRNNAKFREYRSIHCCDIAIFVIFTITVAAILDLSGTYWDHPRSLLGGLYRCAKLGWNRCSTFDNTKVSTFCA